MISYDKVYDLANALKESEEYQAYEAAKKEAFPDEMSKNLYKELQAISLSINAAYMAGKEPEEELTEKYQKLMGVLSLNAGVMNFLQAEYRMNQVMSDVFKILTDTVDMQLGFLSQ
ncbi:YlbF family regulator [Eubacteriales bacterium OttesenSCG-928-M02]|nr:YlbF family regulator [Eubacteriales bacterium OttesenSCG-928-M02]